jgi:hypothetical protein
MWHVSRSIEKMYKMLGVAQRAPGALVVKTLVGLDTLAAILSRWLKSIQHQQAILVSSSNDSRRRGCYTYTCERGCPHVSRSAHAVAEKSSLEAK